MGRRSEPPTYAVRSWLKIRRTNNVCNDWLGELNVSVPSSFFGSLTLSRAVLTRFDQVMSGQQPLKVNDRGEAVRALQTALISLGYSIPDAPTDFFGPHTQNAVRSFQADNINTLGQPDGIVGPDTLGLISSSFKDSPPGDSLVTDVVIYFEGNLPEARLADDDVIPISDLGPSYQATHTAPQRWGYRTTNIDGLLAAQAYAESLTRIGLLEAAGTLSRVYVFGASAGGRMALTMASKLTASDIGMRIVAITDAAFFPNMTAPPKDMADNLPVFRSGDINAQIKLNYYHTFGNHVRFNPIRFQKQWVSLLDFDEIHGQILGFNNPDADLTQEVLRRGLRRGGTSNSDLNAHIVCNEIALGKIRSQILNDLSPLKLLD